MIFIMPYISVNEDSNIPGSMMLISLIFLVEFLLPSFSDGTKKNKKFG
jgi:hypothetical protein